MQQSSKYFLGFAFALLIVVNVSCTRQHGAPSLVLMSLSAHPDDETGAALAYYGKIKGVKTYSLFFTRGEGGQNEIGSQLYGDLGALRTHETLEASRLIGSEPYFLGFTDFGYSKTAKETFRKWGGKDSVLARLVYFIRALKPDVIVTNHDTVTTKPYRQHGNHQAVGIVAFEAFEKAADPSYHPGQLKDDIVPWQVKKLFVRYFDRDSLLVRQPPVSIDMQQKDTSGQTIHEIALAALQQHRSQGMTRLWGQQRYYLLRQDQHYPYDSTDLFSGISPSARITVHPSQPEAGHEPVTDRLSEVTATSATYAHNIDVGVVNTYDDTMEKILQAFHIKHTLLDSSALGHERLDRYSVILLDLRAYRYRPDAEQYNDRLLAYVKRGGNLVVFYNKLDDWNGKKVAPYRLTLSSERVTEEDAPVQILLPEHPLFTTPNRITASDWDGWIQERSIYLPSNDTAMTSAAYQRLLAMSDTDEQQPPTSLLWARYGSGTYTYCALVLYRQLRIANEGALKLFFNMISQPRR